MNRPFLTAVEVEIIDVSIYTPQPEDCPGIKGLYALMLGQAPRSGTLHRVLQAVRRVDNLGVGRAFDADTPVGMRRVSGNLLEDGSVPHRQDKKEPELR